MTKQLLQGTNALENNLHAAADVLYGEGDAPRVLARRAGLRSGVDGNLTFGKVKLTPVGLQVDGDVTGDDWLELGKTIKRFADGVQWLVGDWLNGAQMIYGETYKDVALEVGYTYNTVKTFAWVARNVDLSIRIDKLSFGHHYLIASLPPEEQSYWLQQAVLGNWSISKLRQMMKPQPPALPTGKFEKAQESLLLSYRRANADEQRAMIAQMRQMLDVMIKELKG